MLSGIGSTVYLRGVGNFVSFLIFQTDIYCRTRISFFDMPAMFSVFQGGASVLSRLVSATRAWAGGGGATVRVLSVQPLEGRIPATRVWLAAAGIANFEYLLLYRKNEVTRILWDISLPLHNNFCLKITLWFKCFGPNQFLL